MLEVRRLIQVVEPPIQRLLFFSNPRKCEQEVIRSVSSSHRVKRNNARVRRVKTILLVLPFGIRLPLFGQPARVNQLVTQKTSFSWAHVANDAIGETDRSSSWIDDHLAAELNTRHVVLVNDGIEHQPS